MQGTVYTTAWSGKADELERLLDHSGLPGLIEASDRETILIKPNLVDVLPPPITTPPDLVALLVTYLQGRFPEHRLVIGEGTASASRETGEVYQALGYGRMAAELNVELVDLNRSPTRHLRQAECRRWPEMYLPEIALDGFLLSVPVLKVHTLAGVTLTLKNMMGLAPPVHYQQGGCWKKSSFHRDIQEAIADLNRYRRPDFTLLDASCGMAESHLGGRELQPPPGLLAAAADPVALDAFGCDLLGIDWMGVGHIRTLDTLLGRAAPLLLRPVNREG